VRDEKKMKKKIDSKDLDFELSEKLFERFYDHRKHILYKMPEGTEIKAFKSISELEKALSPEDKKIETNNKN